MPEEKTTIRSTKSGIVTKTVSLSTFPDEMHQKVKDLSHRTETVSQIYSRAVGNMRRAYDKGDITFLVSAPKDGNKVQFWILDSAYEDLLFLAKEFKDDQSTIVYNALLIYFKREY